MAWIRLASGSLWPCALLHASHNLIVQAIFDAGTTPGPLSPYITGEFGAGLAMTIGLAAWLLLRKNRLGAVRTAPSYRSAALTA